MLVVCLWRHFRNACLELFQCQQTMHQTQHAYYSRWFVFQFQSFWLKCDAQGAAVMHNHWQLSTSSSFQMTSSLGSEFVFLNCCLSSSCLCGVDASAGASGEERANGVQETASVWRIPISYMPSFPEGANGALLAIMAYGANCQTLAHQR